MSIFSFRGPRNLLVDSRVAARDRAAAMRLSEEERRRVLRRALGAKAKPGIMTGRSMSVVSHLIEHQLLAPADARAATLAARARGIGVAAVLSETGSVPKEKLTQAIQSIDVIGLAAGLDYDARLPRRILRDYRVMVHAQTEDRLVVSTMSSERLVEQALMPYLEGRRLVFLPFSYDKWEEFEAHIDRIREPGSGYLREDTPENPRSVVSESVQDSEVLDVLLDVAADIGASDIHIEPGKQTYWVFFRILGVRHLVHVGRIEQYGPVCAMVKDRARIDPMETRVPQDGSFNAQIRGKGFDIRVATLPVDGKEKITMRLLDPTKAHMSLSQLGITGVDIWRRIFRYRNGLVLIVGATGSGKTTTLNATLREIDRYSRAVYTAEDPVELRLPFVTQVQINENVGLSFAKAIRAFMRHDPDVMIVGEIRDEETARKAIQAAETGHLVFATIHAESVQMGIRRLLGLGVQMSDFDSLLRGELVQFLVRTLCTNCHGEGCDSCNGVGYAGRTVVSEIAHFEDVQSVHRAAEGHIFWDPLWKDIELKLKAGVTDGREIYRCFTSEMLNYSRHSPLLARILREEEARRDIVITRVAAARVAEMSRADRQQALARSRAASLARLPSIDVEDIVTREVSAMRDDGVHEDDIAFARSEMEQQLNVLAGGRQSEGAAMPVSAGTAETGAVGGGAVPGSGSAFGNGVSLASGDASADGSPAVSSAASHASPASDASPAHAGARASSAVSAEGRASRGRRGTPPGAVMGS